MSTEEITPGERRELRSVVRAQFKVLRAEVQRRKDELKAEIEAELLERYRAEDHAIQEAQREVQRILDDASRQIEQVGQALKDAHPDLDVRAGRDRYNRQPSFDVSNTQKHQLHRALIAAIPAKVGDANLALDRQEADLLRQLSEGALGSEQARAFLGRIPTVGELVPRARLQELEAGLGDA